MNSQNQSQYRDFEEMLQMQTGISHPLHQTKTPKDAFLRLF
jgi:hypothetical protein